MPFVGPATWKRWKEECWVAKCEAEQQNELRSLIAPGLRVALATWDTGLPSNFTDKDLAHEFDTYFKLDNMPETGARKKDQLFRRFDHVTDQADRAKRITGYVKCVVGNRNSVARKIARREGRTGPIAPGELDDSRVLVDPNVLPDAQHSETDFDSWAAGVAAKLAPGFFASLNRVEKAAVWSIANARSVDDAEAHRLAGQKRDALWKARKKFAVTLRLQLHRIYATEDPGVIDSLTLAVARAILPLARKWGATGNPVV